MTSAALDNSEQRMIILEEESLLTGLGMPVFQSRRFLESEGETTEIPYADGHFEVNRGHGENVEGESQELAEFMLNYLFELTRRIQDQDPKLLSSIKLEIPLSEQQAVKDTTWDSE